MQARQLLCTDRAVNVFVCVDPLSLRPPKGLPANVERQNTLRRAYYPAAMVTAPNPRPFEFLIRILFP